MTTKVSPKKSPKRYLQMCINTIHSHEIKGPSHVKVLTSTPAFSDTVKQTFLLSPLVYAKKDDIRPINT